MNFWILYASCLLKLGHACLPSEVGKFYDETLVEKMCKTFDWQGRRLQALVMALEHAAGSEACKKLREWVIQRVIDEDEVVVVADVEGDDGSDEAKAPDVESIEDDEEEEIENIADKVQDKGQENVPNTVDKPNRVIHCSGLFYRSRANETLPGS